jgi:uncharacterized coiled-coil protein SlyX
MAVGAVVGAALTLAAPREYAATGRLVGLESEDAAAQDELSIIHSDSVQRDIVERVGATRILDGLDQAPWRSLFPTCPVGTTATACALTMLQPRLTAEVDATQSGSARVLRLTASHPVPAVAVALVDAAVAADRTVWRGVHATDRASALEPQLAEAEHAISETLAAEARIRADAGVTTITQEMVQSAGQAGDLMHRASQTRERQAAVEAELATTRQMLQGAPATVLDSREVRTGDIAQAVQAALLQLKLERAHMVQLYASDYPGLAELDRKIATVEATSRMQAGSSKSVTRDVRNPLVAGLSGRAAALEAEDAALVRQRAELDRQAGPVAARQAALRDADARLAALEHRRVTQEAVVGELSVAVANLRAQDMLTAARLDERRLLQRPSAIQLPLPLEPVAGGALSGLACGMAAAVLVGRRRRVDLAPCAQDPALAPCASVDVLRQDLEPLGVLRQDLAPVGVLQEDNLPRAGSTRRCVIADERPRDPMPAATPTPRLLTDARVAAEGLRWFARPLTPDSGAPAASGRLVLASIAPPRPIKEFAYVDRQSHFVMIGRASTVVTAYDPGPRL